MKLPDQVSQDLKDGGDLRRLREALPEGCRLLVDGPWADAGKWSVSVEDDELVVLVNKRGATIAEAADACTAALKEPG